MKKLKIILISAFFLLSVIPAQLNAGTMGSSAPIAATKAIESAKAMVLLARLDIIKATDKSDMSSSEKKKLRKEVRTIKGELRELGGGVYLSVSALIIILLLLILLA